MKLVAQVKLLPTPAQRHVLEKTLAQCNVASTYAAAQAHERGIKKNYDLRKVTYEAIKVMGLRSQAAQHAIKRACDSLKSFESNLKAGNYGRPGSKRYRRATAKPCSFDRHAAFPFDDRNLSWSHDQRTISIWTLDGRMKDLVFEGREEALKAIADFRQGESDLLCIDGEFYLNATLEVPGEKLYTPSGWLGADLGIAQIATTSDGVSWDGGLVRRKRERNRLTRESLQKKNTKSAKRRAKARRRKEARFARDVNHQISKQIVAEAKRTERGIALEDLKGIRSRVRLRKPQRVELHSWAFAQLGEFIAYKAKLAGVPVVFVDAAYTSQTCSECGYCDKKNRVSQAEFACRSCGVMENADINAARNIAARGPQKWAAVNHALCGV